MAAKLDRRQQSRLGEGYSSYADSKFRLMLTRIRSYLVTEHHEESSNVASLRSTLAEYTEGNASITAAQAKYLAKKAGIRETPDLEFFWSRLCSQTGVAPEASIDTASLAALIHKRSPASLASHTAAAELGTTAAMEKFFKEYTDLFEKKLGEVEKTASRRIEALLKENQALRTKAASAGDQGDDQVVDREKLQKLQKAVTMAREKLQAYETRDQELHAALAEREEENEKLRTYARSLKQKNEEHEAKLQQTVDVAKKRVAKLAEEIRDLRIERDDYRTKLGLPPVTVTSPQLSLSASGRDLLSPPMSPQTTHSLVSPGVCGACGLPIMDKTYSKTNKRVYHSTCFKCASCGNAITEGNYGEDPTDGKPRCLGCYIDPRAIRCRVCERPIKDKAIEALGYNYHPGCFVCTTCKTPFEGTFFHLQGKPYCEECLAKQ